MPSLALDEKLEKKKWSKIVLEERSKGNVVFLCIDQVMCAPVKEIIKQPAEGLLWDLNRDEVTALTFMDQEGMTHWVNNFAVALVIKELKQQLADTKQQLLDCAEIVLYKDEEIYKLKEAEDEVAK